MSMLEATHMMPGLDLSTESNQEIGNMSPSSEIEDGMFTRICT
jgi:hypothetical protein